MHKITLFKPSGKMAHHTIGIQGDALGTTYFFPAVRNYDHLNPIGYGGSTDNGKDNNVFFKPVNDEAQWLLFHHNLKHHRPSRQLNELMKNNRASQVAILEAVADELTDMENKGIAFLP
ncbi:hypothetical protein [Legionella spiritensis]|uniref:Uncharacterized protein n=1 Tax=Legionella spiritensis TaxID=452 RepID=A0A0W0Z5T2_LEGSP|nr:hypothetical protein [Legionella spiritensis]KTD64520.1 hypothetical protein Lspi_1327 [Legionella spiritensis]SNV33102.1 Uncharacterised protein [Legionella spiritensis]